MCDFRLGSRAAWLARLRRARAILVVAGALLGVALAAAARAAEGTWTSLGPYGGYIFALAVHPDPTGPIYAGTIFGIYRSLDDGDSWEIATAGIGTPSVVATAVDPADPQVAYLGTSAAGVFRTGDAGQTWTATNQGLPEPTVVAIACANGVVLALTSGHGVYRSADQGQSWQASNVGLEPLVGQYRALAVVPEAGVAYLGSNTGVFRSEDAGASWERTAAAPPGASTAALGAATDPLNVYAGGPSSGLWRSADGGASWQATALVSQDVLRIAVDPGDPDRVYAGTSVGLFFSADGGTSFVLTTAQQIPILALTLRPGGRAFTGTLAAGVLRSLVGQPTRFEFANRGLSNSYVGDIHFDTQAGILLVGTADGPWLSPDGGAFWTRAGPFGGQPVFALAVDTSTAGRWYLGLEKGALLRTDDFGATWSDTSSGITPSYVFDLVADPLATGVVYAATSSSGVFRSENEGRTWSRVAFNGESVYDLAVLPTGLVALYAASESGLWASADFGSSWARFDGVPAGPVSMLALSSDDPREPVVILAETVAGLYRSADGGFTFAPVPIQVGPLLSMAVDPSNASVIYIGSGFGVLKSLDAGATFAPTGSLNAFPTALAVTATGRVLVGSPDGVLTSSDGGDTWTPAGSTDGTVVRFAAHPTDPARVYAAADDGGLLVSSDGGTSFVTAPLDARVLSAVVLPSAPDTVLVGTRGAGILATDLSATTRALRSAGLTPFVDALAVDSAVPANIWAGTLFAGMFASDDHGDHWSQAGLGGRVVRSILLPEAGRDAFLVGTDNGAHLSRDGGRTWTRVGIPDAHTPALSLITSPGDGRLYAGILGGFVYTSGDGGLTFDPASPIGEATAFALALDASAGGTLYAATQRGVFLSRNRGGTWTQLPSMAGRTTVSVAVNPAHPEAIFVGTFDQGLFASADGGESWSAVPLPVMPVVRLANKERCTDQPGPSCNLVPREVSDLVFDSTGRLWAATEFGLLKSDGVEWSVQHLRSPGGRVAHVVVDPTDAARVYVTDPRAGVQRSKDGGRRWQRRRAGMGRRRIIAVLHHTTEPGRVYAAEAEGGDGLLFRSDDFARHWRPITVDKSAGNIRAIASDPGNPSRIYVATDFGLFVSDDDGGSWQQRNVAIADADVYELTRVPGQPEVVYAATSKGVLRSSDGGLGWKNPSSGAGVALAFSVAVHGDRPERLFAGTSGAGVLRSNDAGMSWQPMNEGLPFRFVVDVKVDPSDPDHVLAGCEGGGLYGIEVIP